jgi:phosphatidylglycerophosphate synthase
MSAARQASAAQASGTGPLAAKPIAPTRWLHAPIAGLAAQLTLLFGLAATAGLGPAGWVAGVACALTISTALARGLARRPGERFGPASWVTLGRATLAVGVAALAADSLQREIPAALLVALAVAALALDAVDGRLARRTGTATALGARFDGEADALLIAALSVYAAPVYGAWVLAIGAARYAFLAGEWAAPWMRATLPPRRWRRAVAAAQGTVLAVAAAEVLPLAPTRWLLACALALLAASMAESVWWLWRHRGHAAAERERGETGARPRHGRLRTALAVALTGTALAVVWAALVAPDQPDRLGLAAFARLPLELPIVVAAATLLPATPRRLVGASVGLLVGALLVVKVLNLGFLAAFNRPFRPLDDTGYVETGIETVRLAIGRPSADLITTLAVVALAALLVVPALALLRVCGVAAGHRGWTLRAATALGVLWLALRLADSPLASSSSATLAADEARAVWTALEERAEFTRQLAHDRFRSVPAGRLLTALRGKDVLLVFVESYGRFALEGPSVAPGVRAALARGAKRLRAAGFSSRSAYLASPAFGGLSWLAHSTLQSGLRIDGQWRYERLTDSDRLTLAAAFGRAGWRTVAVVPANQRAWPEGSSFYRYDEVYDGRSLGYRGPDFGYAPMPDQYTLFAAQRRELSKRKRPPLFAEIDLVSSHTPWSRIPRLIPWREVGDGRAFNRIPARETERSALLADTDRARAAYGEAIEYSLRSLLSFVARYGDEDLVVAFLGDHQPPTLVTGYGARYDVPATVIARDRGVMRRVAAWGWGRGLAPGERAPVWPMAAFRDRFLTAFGPSQASGRGASSPKGGGPTPAREGR